MTRISVVSGDITILEVDAIVNAANGSLQGGGGVDGAIHQAGGPSIAAEGRAIVARRGPLRSGEVAITGAGRLRSRHVIHAVGPVWGHQDNNDSARLLEACYAGALDLALAHDCLTVAFPNISTGAYGFPADLAADVAVGGVREWVDTNPDLVTEITFVCYTKENLRLYRRLLG